MSFETIDYRKEDGIAWITLNRPQALNSINLQMRDDLWQAISAIRDDPEVGVAVIEGAGEKAFSAGGDLTEFGTAPSYTEARRSRQQRDLWGLMLATNKPLIAAIHGFALGAGLELALCCDIRIATENSSLGLPEVKLAYIPSSGETQLLPRIVPLSITREMLLTGNPIDGTTAMRVGLVQKLTARDNLQEEATGLAQLLLSHPPIALHAAKEIIRRGADMTLANSLAMDKNLATRILANHPQTEPRTLSS